METGTSNTWDFLEKFAWFLEWALKDNQIRKDWPLFFFACTSDIGECENLYENFSANM